MNRNIFPLLTAFLYAVFFAQSAMAGDALVSGSSTSGSKTAGVDETHTFTANAGDSGLVTFDASFGVTMSVYNPDSTLYGSSTVEWANLDDLPQTGTYTLKIISAVTEGSYNIDYVLGADSVEHGTLSNVVTESGSYSGRQLESYQFIANAGDDVYIDFIGSLQVNMQVYTPDGEYYASSGYEWANLDDLPQSGTYTLAIFGNNITGSYTLTYDREVGSSDGSTVVASKSGVYAYHGFEGSCPEEVDPFTPNPVNIALGYKRQVDSDYSSGVLKLVRTYRSDSTWTDDSFGELWRHNYSRSLAVDTGAGEAEIIDGTGALTEFEKIGSVWEAVDDDITASLVDDSGTFIYTLPNDAKEYYELELVSGSYYLKQIEYRGGHSLDFVYDSSDRLDTVTDEEGRDLTFAYDASDRVLSVTTPDSKVFTYSYDANGNLEKVKDPENGTGNELTYHYAENGAPTNALTGITDEQGLRRARYEYDSQGRVTSTKHISETSGSTETYVNEYDIAYATNSVTVTNPLGKNTAYYYSTFNGLRKVVEIEGEPSTHCVWSNRSYSYDSNGWLATKTDWEGNETSYTRDSSTGRVTSVTEGYGTSEAKTTSYTYTTASTTGDLLVDTITETGKTTDYDYDAYGRVTSIEITDTGTSTSRETTFGYHDNTTDTLGNDILGKLQYIDGPVSGASDTTEFTYDSSGFLLKVINPLLHKIEYISRDSAGRPLRVGDANGTDTVYEYDNLGRVDKITEGFNTSPYKGVTTIHYNEDGSLYMTIYDNGVYIKHYYDDAGRHVKTHNSDSGMYYTLDAAGNRTETKYRKIASGSTPTYRTYQTYDELSRLLEWREKDNKVTYAYDKNGSVISATDAYSEVDIFGYDALNRLVQITDRLGTVTDYTLNDLDQLEIVDFDHVGLDLETEYTYNAFGDVLTEDSPDRGLVTYTYDAAGRRASMTDARSKVTNYSYDVLNRVTAITYPADATNNVTLTYDSNTNCERNKYDAYSTSWNGRLCKIEFGSGTPWRTVEYTYDPLDRIAEVKETQGGNSHTTKYGYDNAHYLTSITYPSGRVVTYTYNLNGEITAVTAEINGVVTTLVDTFTYNAFGPATSFNYGNGLTQTDTYTETENYHLTSRTIGSVVTDTYDFDKNNSLTSKSDGSVTTTYIFDDANRLTKEGVQEFNLDTAGNRTSHYLGNGVTDTYSYDLGSSRLNSLAGTSLSRDFDGSLTNDGTHNFVWDDAGRLKEINDGTNVIATYTYDAQNLRTSKTTTSGTTSYVYGKGGKLYGEYDSSGDLLREYVYLHGNPLAQIDYVSSSDVLTYLHLDHLGTPRVGTNTSGINVWTSNADMFGVGTPTGSATVNLRMAGQYFDDESDLFYNWNRYYNPETGRYISSDPIGLDGGINTFAYASANPALYIDPEGLKAISKTISVNGMPFTIFCEPEMCEAYTAALKRALASAVTTVVNKSAFAMCVGRQLAGSVLTRSMADSGLMGIIESCEEEADAFCPPVGGAGAGINNREGPVAGDDDGEEERCKKRLKFCREVCNLDGDVVGGGSDTFAEIRKCTRLCMEEAQCYNY